jgi:hypothetical protein
VITKINNTITSHKSHDHTFSLQTLYGSWKKTFVNNALQSCTFIPFAFVALNSLSLLHLSHWNILYYAEHKADKLKGEVKNKLYFKNKMSYKLELILDWNTKRIKQAQQESSVIVEVKERNNTNEEIVATINKWPKTGESVGKAKYMYRVIV